MIWKGKEIELIHHPDIAPGSWDFWRPGLSQNKELMLMLLLVMLVLLLIMAKTDDGDETLVVVTLASPRSKLVPQNSKND